MGRQRRHETAAPAHRQQAKIHEGLAKQSLSPEIIQELVRTAIKPEQIGDEGEKRAMEQGRLAKTRHPMFWDEEEFL